MGHDRGARLVQPFVSVGVVEMPVRIDKELEWFAPNVGQRGAKLLLGGSKATVDHDLAVGSIQNSDIPT
jgi:hypothetical protein